MGRTRFLLPILGLLVVPAALAQGPAKQGPTVKAGPATQEVAAADMVVTACTDVYAARTIDELGTIGGRIMDEQNAIRDRADIEHTRAAEAYFDTIVAFANARGATNIAIMHFATTGADFALYEANRSAADKPMLTEEISANIDAFLGEGTAQALENPHAADFMARNATLDAAFDNEHAAQRTMIAARRKVVELEAQLNIAKVVAAGVVACIDDQENYLNAAVQNSPSAAGLEPVGSYRMDTVFTATGRTSEIFPDPKADIPYSPAGCHDLCMGDASCVAWNWHMPETPPGQFPPALCEILTGAGDTAASEHASGFSGFGPKALELGLAGPAE